MVKRPLFLTAVCLTIILACILMAGTEKFLQPAEKMPKWAMYGNGRETVFLGQIAECSLTEKGMRLCLNRIRTVPEPEAGSVEDAGPTAIQEKEDSQKYHFSAELSENQECNFNITSSERPKTNFGVVSSGNQEDNFNFIVSEHPETDSYRLLVYTDERVYEPGDWIMVQGKCRTFSKATNPGQFDAYRYYAAQKILLSLSDAEILVHYGGKNSWKKCLHRIKYRIYSSYEGIFGGEEAAAMSAISLGERALLGEEQKRLYQEGGIAHIFAISGVKTLNLVSLRETEKPVNWAFLRLHKGKNYIIKRRF